MEILVVGGTRFIGVHLVRNLIADGHKVTIATRGKTHDPFGGAVRRITLERTDPTGISEALHGKTYDIVYDSQAYSSNEIKYLLDAVKIRGRYIQISTVSVYSPNFTTNLHESDFDPTTYPLKWCSRDDFDYGETKRQAECAIFQAYSHILSIAVRFPIVIGEDDYTKRLHFYSRRIKEKIPIHIDNPQTKMEFITSHEAGKFLAWLADKQIQGSINAANKGSVTIAELTANAILSPDGEKAPFNGYPSYGLNTEKAERAGYAFPDIRPEIFNLLRS